MAVVMPEEAAAMFARNPELARANPDALGKVNAALAAKKAAHEATAKAAPAETAKVTRSAPNRPTLAGLNAAQGAIKAYRQLPSSGSGIGKSMVRLAVAVAAFLVALEVASYVSGRYFNYSLGKGAKTIQGAAQYVGLYPGQKIGAPTAAAPAAAAAGQGAHPVPGVAG